MNFHVNLSALVGSAVHVSGQGEDLAAAHVDTDATMAAAHAGWQGASAAALAEKLTAWGDQSRTLLTRISDHSQGMHSSAQEFATQDRQGHDALAALPPSATQA